jgi:hypothetical protein
MSRELDGAALSFGAYERPNKYPHHFSRYVGCASRRAGLVAAVPYARPYLPRDISTQRGFSVLCKLDGSHCFICQAESLRGKMRKARCWLRTFLHQQINHQRARGWKKISRISPRERERAGRPASHFTPPQCDECAVAESSARRRSVIHFRLLLARAL